MRIVLIIREDIKLFPPVTTIARSLVSLGHKVEIIGHYSDAEEREKLVRLGIVFHSITPYDINAGKLKKLAGNLRFKKEVTKIVDSLNLYSEKHYLWVFQGLGIALLHKLIARHPSILHTLEFTGKKIRLQYRILCLSYNAEKVFQNADKVVNCEYNRSQIMKGFLNLKRAPYVLPNKMLIDEESLLSAPEDVKRKVEEISRRIEGRKVILYQGIFLQGERRLDEFCDAVNAMGEEYVLILMGSDNQPGYRQLQQKYKDTNVLFVPFINPPYHLLVTRLAHVGILTYFPRPDNINTVINPLYCAPNKIFEYGKFGIPMIGNDIPGLHYPFNEYHCGVTVGYPMSPSLIMETLEKIFSDYDRYSKGAMDYYNSVDVNKIIEDILK